MNRLETLALVLPLALGTLACSGGSTVIPDSGTPDAGNADAGSADVTKWMLSNNATRPQTVVTHADVIAGMATDLKREPADTDAWLKELTPRIVKVSAAAGGVTSTSDFELKVNGNVVTMTCRAVSGGSGATANCGFSDFRVELVNPGAKSLKVKVACSGTVSTTTGAVSLLARNKSTPTADYCNRSLPLLGTGTGQDNLAGGTATAEPASSPSDALYVDLMAEAAATGGGTADATFTFTIEVVK